MSVIRDLFTSSVNSTMMSINERFTYLQKNVRPVQTTILTIRANNAANQQASAKNRRLAMQMERRLSAMAALKIKKKSVRQRLGLPLIVGGGGKGGAGGGVVVHGNNVRDRLTLPTRGRGRLRNTIKNGRVQRTTLRRSQSIQSLSGGNLQRSRSMQSLNNDMAVPHRSRSRSRARNRTPSVGPKEAVARRRRSSSAIRQGRLQKVNSGFFMQQTLVPQRRKRFNSVNFRNKKAKNIGNQKDQRKAIAKRGGRNSGVFQRESRGQNSFRGRAGRGRGRGRLTRNTRPNRNNPPGTLPTKEELDKELEQYMANTKSQLDKDIDTYMKENPDTNEMWD